MLTLLTAHFARWLDARRRRALHRALLAKDDRLLDDMGIARTELERALGLPIDIDARDAAVKWTATLCCLDGRR